MMTNKLPEVGKRYKNPNTRSEWILIGIKPFNDGFTFHLKSWSKEDFFHHITNQASFFDYYEELPEEQEEPKFEMADKGEIIFGKPKFNCGYCGGSGKLALPCNPPLYQKCPLCNLQEKDEVQEAKEELIKEIRQRVLPLSEDYNNGGKWYNCYTDLRDAAFDLIDARDKQNLRDKENSLSGGEAIVTDTLKSGIKQMEDFNNYLDEKYPNCRKPESIWRSVEELPTEGFKDAIIEHYDGFAIGQVNHQGFYGFGGLINKPEIKRFCTVTDFINDYEDLKAKVEKLLEGKNE